MTLAMLFGSPVELAIVAGVVVVLFGGAKVAGFGKSLGESLKEFKKATREEPDVKDVPPVTNAASTDSTTKVD